MINRVIAPLLIKDGILVQSKNYNWHLPIGNIVGLGDSTGKAKANWVDSHREFTPLDQKLYSWWSYRANARANNKGWRIDYAMVSEPLKRNIERAFILPQAMHSDHCPVGVTLAI